MIKLLIPLSHGGRIFSKDTILNLSPEIEKRLIKGKSAKAYTPPTTSDEDKAASTEKTDSGTTKSTKTETEGSGDTETANEQTDSKNTESVS